MTKDNNINRSPLLNKYLCMYTYYPCWIQQYGYLIPSSLLPFIKNHEFRKQQTKQLKQYQQVKLYYHIVAYLLLI
jgi:hypothetical protein